MPRKKRPSRLQKPAPPGTRPARPAAAVVRDAATAAAVFSAPLLWTAPPILGATARRGQAMVTALLYVALLSHALAAILTDGKLRLPRLCLLLPAAALVAASAVSSAWSVNRDASVLFTLQLLAGAMLLALVAVPENRETRAWAASALVLSAALGAVYGLRSYVFEWAAGGAVWRTFGPFFNPNLFAGFLVIVIPVALVLAANSRGPLRVCCGFACALLVAALLLTGSRGGWMAFAAGILSLCVASGAALRRARAGIAAAAAAVIVLVALALILAPLRTRLLSSFSAQEHSNRFRLLTWQATLRIAGHYPVLGSGPGTFEHVFPRYSVAGFTRMAHQNYLQVAAETGLVGLACFLWLLGAMAAATATAVKRAQSRAEGLMSAACFSGLVAFMVHSLLDYTWFVGGIATTVWLVGGMGSGAHGQSLALRVQPSGSWRRTALAAAFAWLLWLTWITVAAALGEHAALRGQQALRAGDRYEAVQLLREAVDWCPRNSAYRRLLGWALGSEDGAAQMRQAMALAPTDSVPHAWLARMLRRSGNLEEAKAEFERAIALNPNFTGAYREIAEIAMQQKHFAEARKAYRAVVRIEQSPYGRVSALEQMVETDYAFAHYGLGLLARDARTARAEFEQALRIIEDFEARAQGMSRLLEEMGQADPSRSAEVEALKGKVLLRLADLAGAAGDEKARRQFLARADEADGDARREVAEEDALLANSNAPR